MKFLSVLFLFLVCSMAEASVKKARVRLSDAFPNPRLAPFGQLVDLSSGEELYVSKIISVVAPKEWQEDCAYEIHYTVDSSKAYKAIMLVPPVITLSCGN